MNSVNIQSQSFTVTAPHDSLLFDGNDVEYFNYPGKCNIKVFGVVGTVTGTYLVDTILNVCGAMKNGTVQRTGQVHNGVELVPGYDLTLSEPKDEPYSAVSIAIPDASLLISHNAVIHLNEDCSIQMKKGAAMISGNFNLSTGNTKVTHNNTKYTIESVYDGDKVTDIVKVYEGSVRFSLNFESDELKKRNQKRKNDISAEIAKRSSDIQSGKITPDEFKQKFSDLQTKLLSISRLDYFVTVNAGYSSTAADGEQPADPVPFDTNADRWWDK